MHEPFSSRADAVHAEAGAWITRKDSAEWSAADQATLDAWLAASTAHMIAFIRLEEMWKRADRLKALAPQSKQEARFSRRLASDKVLRRSIGAAAIAAIIGAAVIFTPSQPAETVYSTAIGGHKLLKLADGSRIDLNTNTTLRLSRSVNGVTARLDKGEAFFQIKHDPDRLFVVLAGRHRVTDIGTEFLVRAQPNHLEVALISGSARLDAPDGRMQTPILLRPGDELTVANNLITTTRKSTRRLAEELGWRRGMLFFENTPLGDVVAEFNRYGERKIVVADQKTARTPLSASFPTDGSDSFLELAKAMLNVRIERRGDETIISQRN